MTKEINFLFLVKVLKNAWWKILIFTVAVALAVAAFTEFVIPKKYSSTTEFYVLNTSTTSEYTTTALLSAAEYLANDYIEIIRGDQMVNIIIEDIKENGYDLSPSDVRSMITASTSSETSTFRIIVTSTDKALAYYISDSIKENSPKVIKDITRPSYSSNLYFGTKYTNPNGDEKMEYTRITEEYLECVKVIRSPEIANAPVSPSVIKNALVSAVLAACVAYVFFLIVKLSDTTIKSEEDIKELVEETVIGDIPYWKVQNSEQDVKEEQK